MRTGRLQKRRRGAFTVIELLVVISIIGLLMALVLPAIQMARESGRRTTCKNNLRQIGLAVLSHESAHRRIPSAGWSYLWVGDADRGTGRDQPGGWIYSSLPYVERRDLRQLGRGTTGPLKLAAATQVTEKSLAAFHCPSRRRASLYPYDPAWPPVNANLVPEVAKSDYAINGGDTIISSGPGPGTLAAGDDPSYPWKDFSKATGLAHMRSEVPLASILDGASLTYLTGEKYLHASGTDLGDDQSMYAGYDIDSVRWTIMTPMQDSEADGSLGFGSMHFDTCHFVFCDGSVREISYAIDGEIHRRLGNRRDREIVDEAEF